MCSGSQGRIYVKINLISFLCNYIQLSLQTFPSAFCFVNLSEYIFVYTWSNHPVVVGPATDCCRYVGAVDTIEQLLMTHIVECSCQIERDEYFSVIRLFS